MVGGRALVYCVGWDPVSTPRHLSGRGVKWILLVRRYPCIFCALLSFSPAIFWFPGVSIFCGCSCILNNLLTITYCIIEKLFGI